MVHHITDAPAIEAAGKPPKTITEFIGLIATGDERVSIARMRSPEGWSEPPQRPTFDEFSVILDGLLRVDVDGRSIDVRANEAIHVPAGTLVRYSTPAAGGADYLAVCLPAFSPATVHRVEPEAREAHS